MRENHGLG
ncbi:hypothetical protein D018_0085A, partial [Vibrio parahaemolyticus VP2007-007]